MQSLSATISKLKNKEDEMCVTISIPTHRTFPENKQDEIQLNNMISEAESQLIQRFGKREAKDLIDKLQHLPGEIDTNYMLDSLHIYASEHLLEIIRLPWKLETSEIIVGKDFDFTYLEEAQVNSKEYLILLLSQGGVHLYQAFNDGITREYKEDGFPFKPTPHYITHADKASDPKKIDRQVEEYFNTVDKSVIAAARKTTLECVVVSTERNFQHLMTVADRKDIYKAHSNINYNQTSPHSFAKQAWKAVNN